ncbi:hypothetical protein PDIDSM_6723 [Penicillium digitatum]|nr:hypothetical protein PDIDSM_6723 [Penicillium digitatum]
MNDITPTFNARELKKLKQTLPPTIPVAEIRDKTCQLYPSTNLPVGPRHQASQLPSNDNTDVLARLRRLEEIVIINGPASSPLGQDNTQALSLPSLLAPTPRQSCVVQEEQSSANGYDLVGSRDHIVRLTG